MAVSITFRLPAELATKVRARCDREHVQLSPVLRDFLTNWVQGSNAPDVFEGRATPRPLVIDDPPSDPNSTKVADAVKATRTVEPRFKS